MNEHTAKMTADEFRTLANESGLTRNEVARKLRVSQRIVYVWLKQGISKPLLADIVRRELKKSKRDQKGARLMVALQMQTESPEPPRCICGEQTRVIKHEITLENEAYMEPYQCECMYCGRAGPMCGTKREAIEMCPCQELQPSDSDYSVSLDPADWEAISKMLDNKAVVHEAATGEADNKTLELLSQIQRQLEN